MPRVIPCIYQHNQTVPAAVWTINHKLGNNGGRGVPAVEVLLNIGGEQVKVIPASVEKVDANTVKITFSSPHTGKATIVI